MIFDVLMVMNIKMEAAGSPTVLQQVMWYNVSEDWNLKCWGMFLAALCTSWHHGNFSSCH
jgi:hypothetical protein